MKNYSLPALELCRKQADWLSEARARILRKAEIARRHSMLDLGCGYGIITEELRRRSDGFAVALDHSLPPLKECASPKICADALHLPFFDRSFDLIFCQNVLLWTGSTISVVKEARRVLAPGGIWVLFEPDYGGLMEEPEEIVTRELWLPALRRAGADPFIGRKLPALLSNAGFRVSVDLLPHLVPPDSSRFDFLQELPLTVEENARLESVRHASKLLDSSRQLSHLPYYLIIADCL